MVDISFNNILGSSFGIYMKTRPSIPAAKEKVDRIEVPGRDGELLVRKGVYESTEITCEFNYIGPENLWARKWREAKRWLSVGNAELKFSDDPEVFYIISCAEVHEITKRGNRIGDFKATFITKDGLSYLMHGKREYDISEYLFNHGITSNPLYRITGNGLCTLMVNGRSVTANVSGDIIIDTEKMISYRSDGKSQNTALSGDYEDIYLQEGENIVSVTDGFTCKVVPRWRCL